MFPLVLKILEAMAVSTFQINRTCCFTGHRISKLPWGNREDDVRCLRLKQELYEIVTLLYSEGIRWYVCGMALGCDTYFAEAVIRARSERKDIRLEAAIPCPGQSSRWSGVQRERYAHLVASCDYRTVISPQYTFDCMEKRNRYMVDKSGTLVAATNGGSGGTMNTINYAKRMGRRIIEIRI